MRATLEHALAWRRGRQNLTGGARSAAEVVRRLGAVPAWLGDAELAVRLRLRLAEPTPDAVAGALRDGTLITTYAYRGSMHLLAADQAGVHLAVRCANRQWELRSWQEHYDLTPQDWPDLRAAVREVVADGPVRHSELVDQVATGRFRHLRDGLANPSHTLLKPLAWQGDICFGPAAGGGPTFQSPAASPHWTGLPDLDDAGRAAVRTYLGAYGPAPRESVHYWLVAGLSAGRKRLDRWLTELRDDIAEIDVDGVPMLLLHEHLDELHATEPDPDAVDLLPGYDQWVMGPGTADPRIVPPANRQPVTRGANVVLRGGRVAGTWKLDGRTPLITWFAEPGDADAAVTRLTTRL
jgi:hypothetical protein